MGLINAQQMQQMPPQATPAQPPQATPSQAGGDDTARRRVILAATKILYDPATMKSILDLIRKAKTPEAGLAQATTLVMARLAEMSKGAMPQAVKVPAAKGVMALIAELAEKAGIIKSAAQAVKAASQMIAQAIMRAANIKPEQMKQPMVGGQRQAAQPQMGV